MKTKTYYRITFPDNTCYVGSTVNYKRRVFTHQTRARCNRHDNKNVQAVYDKYGLDDWVFEIISTEQGDKEHHTKREYTIIQENPNNLNIYRGRECLNKEEYYKNSNKHFRTINRDKYLEANRKYVEENREEIRRKERERYWKRKESKK
jgi:predicted GIY-YIG superfamily endonuclease